MLFRSIVRLSLEGQKLLPRLPFRVTVGHLVHLRDWQKNANSIYSILRHDVLRQSVSQPGIKQRTEKLGRWLLKVALQHGDVVMCSFQWWCHCIPYIHEVKWRHRTDHRTTPPCWRCTTVTGIKEWKSDNFMPRLFAVHVFLLVYNSTHNSLQAYLRWFKHTRWPKNGTLLVRLITSSDIDQFSNVLLLESGENV